jgi:hypothetical protein
MAGKYQLVSVAPDGTISTIRAKKNEGLDLREVGGMYAVRRVSEIIWNPDLQGFIISLIKRDDTTATLTIDDLHATGRMSYCALKDRYGEMIHARCGGVLAFQEYEDAVTVEVEYLSITKEIAESLVW